MLGTPDPGALSAPAHWAPVETSAIAAYHKEQLTLAQARKAHQGGGADAPGASSGSGATGPNIKDLVRKEMANVSKHNDEKGAPQAKAEARRRTGRALSSPRRGREAWAGYPVPLRHGRGGGRRLRITGILW